MSLAAARAGTRPKPVEVAKQIVIIRDESELVDETEGEGDVASEQAGHAVVKVKPPEEVKKPKEIEIPIPPVTEVPTYTTDYLPLHSVGLTYLRAPSKAEALEYEHIEYDLDLDDMRILREINQDNQDRLTDKSLELLLWKLEVANAEATERAMSQAGARTLHFAGHAT